MTKTYEDLEKELNALKSKSDEIRAKMREEKRRLKEESEKRNKEAQGYLGQLLLKATGLSWYEINIQALSDLLKDEATIGLLSKPAQDTKEELSSLKSFVKDTAKTKPAQNKAETFPEEANATSQSLL